VVDSYRFAKGGDEAVSVTARIDEGVPVHVGAAAYISANLVTGIASVEINNGPSDSALLIDAPPGERYPVIAEGSSDIRQGGHSVSAAGGQRRAGAGKDDTLLSDETSAPSPDARQF